MRFKGSFLVGAGCVWLATSVAWCQSNAPADAILHHAIQLRQAGDLAGAVSEYRNYLQLAPNDITAHSNLGVALAHEGHFDEAVAEYSKALELQPSNPADPPGWSVRLYRWARVASSYSGDRTSEIACLMQLNRVMQDRIGTGIRLTPSDTCGQPDTPSPD